MGNFRILKQLKFTVSIDKQVKERGRRDGI
jgi:hypothetical protein